MELQGLGFRRIKGNPTYLSAERQVRNLCSLSRLFYALLVIRWQALIFAHFR